MNSVVKQNHSLSNACRIVFLTLNLKTLNCFGGSYSSYSYSPVHNFVSVETKAIHSSSMSHSYLASVMSYTASSQAPGKRVFEQWKSCKVGKSAFTIFLYKFNGLVYGSKQKDCKSIWKVNVNEVREVFFKIEDHKVYPKVSFSISLSARERRDPLHKILIFTSFTRNRLWGTAISTTENSAVACREITTALIYSSWIIFTSVFPSM